MPAEIVCVTLMRTPSEYDQLKMMGDKEFQKKYIEAILEQGQQELKRYSELRDQGYQIDHVALIESNQGKELYFLLYRSEPSWEGYKHQIEKENSKSEPLAFDDGVDPLPAPYDTGYNDDIPF